MKKGETIDCTVSDKSREKIRWFIYNVSAPVGQNALKKVVGCPTES
jgi:hypothetical protein